MRIEDKSTLRLFYEVFIIPSVKYISIIGTATARTIREITWGLCGVMIYNSYALTTFKVEGNFLFLIICGTLYYNVNICRKSMRY